MHVHLVMCGRFNFCINYVVEESACSRHSILITLSCVYFFFNLKENRNVTMETSL